MVVLRYEAIQCIESTCANKEISRRLLNQDIGVVEKNETRNLVLCQCSNLVFSQQAFHKTVYFRSVRLILWCSWRAHHDGMVCYGVVWYGMKWNGMVHKYGMRC